MEGFVNVLMSGLLLVALWWLYFVEYKRYRCDRTRQELFTIRDELFMKAASGLIPFNSPAYCITRSTLNGMIRFTHELGIMKTVMIYFINKRYESADTNRYVSKLNAAVNELPAPAKKAVLDAQYRMHLIFISHLIHNSLLLTITLQPIWYFHYINKKLANVQRRLTRGSKARAKWAPIDFEANRIGDEIARSNRGEPPGFAC